MHSKTWTARIFFWSTEFNLKAWFLNPKLFPELCEEFVNYLLEGPFCYGHILADYNCISLTVCSATCSKWQTMSWDGNGPPTSEKDGDSSPATRMNSSSSGSPFLFSFLFSRSAWLRSRADKMRIGLPSGEIRAEGWARISHSGVWSGPKSLKRRWRLVWSGWSPGLDPGRPCNFRGKLLACSVLGIGTGDGCSMIAHSSTVRAFPGRNDTPRWRYYPGRNSKRALSKTISAISYRTSGLGDL